MGLLLSVFLKKKHTNKTKEDPQVVAAGEYKGESHHCMDADGCSPVFHVQRLPDKTSRSESAGRL